MQGKRSDCIRNLGRGVDETWGMCTRNKSVGKKRFLKPLSGEKSANFLNDSYEI